MKNIKRLIVPAATLTIICVLTALCLSVVNAITKGPIADAEQRRGRGDSKNHPRRTAQAVRSHTMAAGFLRQALKLRAGGLHNL